MQQLTLRRPSKPTRSLIVWATFATVVLLLVAIAFLCWRWPFTRAAILKDLEEASLSKVQVSSFRETYFPRPGCVLENVTFQHNPLPGSDPLITVKQLRIESTFTGLFTRHVMRIRAEGLHVLVPPRGSGQNFAFKRSTFVVDELIADGAQLDVASRDPQKQALQFSFHNFSLSNIGNAGPASFKATFSNPEPPGEITTNGTFGPWNPEDIAKVAVSGHYLFQNADLGAFHGIAGILSSSGNFSGTLDRIEVQGQTATPTFKVASSSHETDLQTQFHAIVNGKDGNTSLPQVSATFWKTTIQSQADIEGTHGQPGKSASVELYSQNGRIQDLLLLFATSERSPMSGTVSFHAKVSIPHGRHPFLEKVELQGDFGIDSGTFSKPATQEGINHLSQGALGDKNPGVKNPAGKDSTTAGKAETATTAASGDDNPAATVLSDLKGHVILHRGAATFSHLSFTVPGALAQMQGTYNLITEKIDLHGTLKTISAPSNTTQGVKSLFMKVLDPFFKRKRAGYSIPVKITGTYEHPAFGLDLGNSDAKTARKQQQHASKLLKGSH